MEQVGFVLETKGEKARIEVKRISGCSGSCKSCSGCDTPSLIVDIDNTIGAKIGDLVEIQGESKTILKYTFIIYLIPAALFVMGIILGINRFHDLGYENYELYGFLTGIISLIFSFGILNLIDRRMKNRTDNMLRMIRIIND